MRYEILGPLRVREGQQLSFISAKKIETILAVLLARADQAVTIDELMREIWGERMPRRATAGIHVYISQIRKFLSRPNREGTPLLRQPSGYLLHLGEDEIDYHDFTRLVERGRAHLRERDHAAAAGCFDEALALWRGPALVDLHEGPILCGFATLLTEERIECTEMLIKAQLRLGRHREQVGRLYSLITEFPLREGFYRQLMLALYRSHRRADALHVYQVLRKALNEQLGLEPCRELRDLQRAILLADDGARDRTDLAALTV